jgi:hypothetical protein
MLISQRHRLGFIHIPKCGGTSIKHLFAEIDDTETRFAGQFDHPELGRVFLGHLPLWALRDHYPGLFEAMRGYRLFAICRDPHDRFESAISQRMQLLHRKRINDFSSPEVMDFTGKVIEKIKAQDRIVAADLCHFIPQSDFIFLDGQRIVGEVYPLAQINRLIPVLSVATGIAAATDFQANQTLNFRIKQSEGLLRRLSGRSRKLLPMGLHSWAKRRGKQLLTSGGNQYEGFSRREPDLSRFIQTYYAQDFRLLDTA